MRGRSTPQKLTAGGVLVVLLTAPFGGLRSDAGTHVQPLRLGDRIETGPFDITLEKVVSLSDLKPAVTPDPGDRLLVIEVRITNPTDRAESSALISGAFASTGSGAVPWSGDSEPQPRIYDVSDGVRVDATEYVNPGVSHEYAVVVQQSEDFDPSGLTLSVSGYDFQSDDPLTLDDDAWVLDDQPLVEGPVTIEVKG